MDRMRVANSVATVPLMLAFGWVLRFYRSSTLAWFASAVVAGGLNYAITTLAVSIMQRFRYPHRSRGSEAA